MNLLGPGIAELHRRAKRKSGRAGVIPRLTLALVIAALVTGGVAIRQVLAYSVDRYQAANTAADIHGDVGELLGLNYEITGSGSLISSQTELEASIRGEVDAEIAAPQATGHLPAEVQKLAQMTAAGFAGLDQTNSLIAEGLVSGSEQVVQAIAANDSSLDAIMNQSSIVADGLRGAADQASRVAGYGITAIGAGVLLALAALLTWYGRRRRRATSEEIERKSLARFESMVEQSSDVSMLTEPTGRQTYISPAIEHVLGYGREEWARLQPKDFLHPDEMATFRRLLAEVAAGGRAGPEDCRIRHADGSGRLLEVRLTDLTNSSVGAILWNARDVTDRRRLEAELERAAFKDSLTGLANRALFRDRLNHAVERGSREPRPIAVLLADLDGFNSINDSLGHDAGDEALVEVAARLTGSVRPSDTVARLGGDEFTILLEDISGPWVPDEVAARVQQVMRQPLHIGGREIRLGVSIGIARASSSDTGAQELLRNADMAMYSAKNKGKGRSASFEPAMFARAEEDLRMAGELEGALGRGELEVHYQPTFAIGSQDLVGLEALVRWRHPERGLVPPAAFIPVAEQTGLISPIGLWVMEEACHRARAWQTEYPKNPPVKMGINLSGRQLNDDHIVADVSAILSITGVDASSIVLEITESLLMRDVGAVTAKLHRLKALGVRLAIDDFGTGYSSLAYLQQFPVDILKIDRAFVEAAASDAPGGKALVRAIVDMGVSLRLETIAEGIENQEQADFLQTVGCHLGQGYLFARPMPAADIERLLSDRKSAREEPFSVP